MRSVRLAFTILGFLILANIHLHAQAKIKTVSPSVMQQIYQQIKTPFKYGLVLVPENNSKKVDCPTVFRKDGHWYMSYLVYDGKGYETWLAKSEDLLHWKTLGKMLSFSDSTEWDANQKAGYMALQNVQWGGNYEMQTYDNKYWMSYIGGPTRGYEAGTLSIGIASTSKEITTPHEWDRFPAPALTSKDADVRWWENKKIFKSTVIWDKDKITGYPFVMYYNANGDSNLNRKSWYERIGMAVSNDMKHWTRFGKDAVMDHFTGITGDAVIQKVNKVWVMFYFGAFWKEGRQSAFDRFACSYDLVHWTDWTGDDLISSSKDYDDKFAHKPFVVNYKGITYHFYCAVNKKDQRGIAVATSVDKGTSLLQFSNE